MRRRERGIRNGGQPSPIRAPARLGRGSAGGVRTLRSDMLATLQRAPRRGRRTPTFATRPRGGGSLSSPPRAVRYDMNLGCEDANGPMDLVLCA